MLFFFLAIFLSTSAHIAATAWSARLLGIPVQEVSIGLGPTLVRVDAFRLGLFPIGGYVSLRSLQKEDLPSDVARSTVEGESLIDQIAVASFGCLLLLIIAFVLTGSQAFTAFLSMPAQVLTGAISPFGTAQNLLDTAITFLRDAPATSVIGEVAARIAALNLLPFPASNGGDALAAIGRASGVARIWPEAATVLLLFVRIALLALWLLALAAWLSGA